MLNQKCEEHHEMINVKLYDTNFLLSRKRSCSVKNVNGNVDILLMQSKVLVGNNLWLC